MFDFTALQPETLLLEAAEIDRARQISRQLSSPQQQWQVYLNALALAGFSQWIHTQAPDLPLEVDQTTCLSLPKAEEVSMLRVQVGPFRLGLIALGSLMEEIIEVPVPAVDWPEYIPHFYVLLEVLEDLGQVQVQGFLRYDRLQQKRQAHALTATLEQTYNLPLAWFEARPDRLLLYLCCLDPKAIPLPHTTGPQVPVANLLVQPLLQPVINVGLWLRDELEALMEQIQWILLPDLVPALRSSMLSPVDELAGVILELERRSGSPLLPQSRGAYHDFLLGGHGLRLYAITWPQISGTGTPEWSLLLILGSQTTVPLPAGITLQIRDATEILVDQTLDETLNPTYLFARLIGNQEEPFTATIALFNGMALTLPAFVFQPAPEPRDSI
ncbi:hypothetical protein BST81_07335 [Leptolyngbya sp. 'hensonii']|uniref:DUF1822 family protein n=1 Tax=Leptolyngbya sp. 'hensonii' TaxID=1922337 RepID=UPI00094FAEEC|nr:DUF1822 family protein [Leptolyngbya sp. 'hensonii']OLP19026.1 hypothetical protein BST81_07335 [Leptolyngbya sp. 'hensonii']